MVCGVFQLEPKKMDAPSSPPPRPACGLTYEYLVAKDRVDNEDNCTAKWADQSGKICGAPLGAHPHAHAPTGQNIL